MTVSASSLVLHLIAPRVKTVQTVSSAPKKMYAPTVGAYIFFGALEAICTGFTLGAIKCSTKEEAEWVKDTFRRTMIEGLKA